jgi:hypothetical protein
MPDLHIKLLNYGFEYLGKFVVNTQIASCRVPIWYSSVEKEVPDRNIPGGRISVRKYADYRTLNLPR